MKKLAAAILIVFVVGVIGIAVSPTEKVKAEKAGDLAYSIYDGEVTITGCNKSASGDMVIPSKLEGYPVTSIGDKAFDGCSSLTSITIPNGVTSIKGYAFWGCSSLTSISISDSVTSIEGEAFMGCSSLASITIPESVTSIGMGVFWECSSLMSITIPKSVTSIQNSVFHGCSSLTSITIPESVTSIGAYAFIECSSLTSITIPESVTDIGLYAFEGCSSLTSITIPEGVMYIGGHAFRETGYYNDEKNWEDGVLYLNNWLLEAKDSIGKCVIKSGTRLIADEAFEGCSSLTSITIPESVTRIGLGVFEGCNSLTSITIPESVTIIDMYAFEGCSSLTSITIPEGVMYIGGHAFRETGYYNDEKNWEDGVLYLNNWLLEAKDSISKCVIKSGTRLIAGEAFEGCSRLTSIIIPESITSMGWGVFNVCSDDLVLSIHRKNTYAVNYAERNKLSYVLYGDEDVSEEIIFPDVPANAWYSEAVNDAVERGIFSGYASGNFGPADNIQRQDFLVVLARLDGVDLSAYASKTQRFSDVAPGSYFYAAVAWGAENGIVTGYNDGRFGTGDCITREQILTFFYRYAKYKKLDMSVSAGAKAKYEGTYSDFGGVSAFAQDAVVWALEKGAISGKTPTTVVPLGTASRAEAAQIFYNVKKKNIF